MDPTHDNYVQLSLKVSPFTLTFIPTSQEKKHIIKSAKKKQTKKKTLKTQIHVNLCAVQNFPFLKNYLITIQSRKQKSIKSGCHAEGHNQRCGGDLF